MRVTYMPGGVGAVAYNAVVAQRPGDAGTITAFSSGSLLNLAQGKFGRFDENAVKWLAAIGTSYGAIAVRTDSPYKNLDDLVKALKADPSKVVIGSGGTVGSQDWMQTALIAKAAGINPRDLRYVALEGGGEIATALLGGHIQVGSTDISDSMPHILSGDMRLLAVFSEERLPEAAMANIPTAKEQGYDIVWPVVRGFYLGPKVSDEDRLVEERLRPTAGLRGLRQAARPARAVPLRHDRRGTRRLREAAGPAVQATGQGLRPDPVSQPARGRAPAAPRG